MMEEIRELAQEAKSYGLAVVIWSYPRGAILANRGKLPLMLPLMLAIWSLLLGANIIKVKPPSEYIEQTEAKKIYEQHDLASKASSGLKERIEIVKKAAFDGRRLVVFSGGGKKMLMIYIKKYNQYMMAVAMALLSAETASKDQGKRHLPC